MNNKLETIEFEQREHKIVKIWYNENTEGIDVPNSHLELLISKTLLVIWQLEGFLAILLPAFKDKKRKQRVVFSKNLPAKPVPG